MERRQAAARGGECVGRCFVGITAAGAVECKECGGCSIRWHGREICRGVQFACNAHCLSAFWLNHMHPLFASFSPSPSSAFPLPCLHPKPGRSLKTCVVPALRRPGEGRACRLYLATTVLRRVLRRRMTVERRLKTSQDSVVSQIQKFGSKIFSVLGVSGSRCFESKEPKNVFKFCLSRKPKNPFKNVN